MRRLRLDPESGVPTYLQLVDAVEQALRIGDLQPGDQMPTAGAVVAELATNANTVLRSATIGDHFEIRVALTLNSSSCGGRRGYDSWASSDRHERCSGVRS
jgi:hypothetical protein